jgi:hypothetical protein
MGMQYGEYCLVDPLVYDIVDRLNDTHSRFSISQRPIPPGWQRSERSIWVALRPLGGELPAQGWKIHISGTLDNAEAVLGIVWDFCLKNKVALKFIRSSELLAVNNAKYASRASSGKLVTLYPVNEAQLEFILTELGSLLEGYESPYILSDLRWGSGPLYVRYGAFLERYYRDEKGDPVPAIAGPDGSLVPDVRSPVFRVPPWAEIPHFLAAQIADRVNGDDQDEADFPYRIEKALHFSNGGGVYLAEHPRTGQRVVIREARPFAGLDASGADAVARLRRERRILEGLTGVDFAPNFVDYFTYWEHEFLVEEYVEGTLLQQCVVERHPLILHQPSASELAEYTAWALKILNQVEQALDALHRRGILYGDLHWHNVLVKPDGGVVLVDFEVATYLNEGGSPGLGAPGFASSTVRSGLGVDDYALACLQLAMFLPLTFLLDKDPTKAVTLVRGLEERFPVPGRFGKQILRRLGVHADGNGHVPLSAPRMLFDADMPDWDAVQTSIIEGILASATPDRTDRLFPGDIEQFRSGGFPLAYGAAGVLYALDTVGVNIDPRYTDWLIEATRTALFPSVGLYNGLHGVAYVLCKLGLRDEALTILDRALVLSDEVRTVDLFGGQSGIALNLLYFAHVTGDQTLRDIAFRKAEQLTHALKNATESDAILKLPDRPGLMHGFAGPALLFIHLYEQTNDEAFLEFAARALKRDLAHCEMTRDGTLQVQDAPRVVAYLATGSAGIGVVLHRYLRHRRDDEFAEKQAYIQRACQVEFTLESGLFRGRAGFIAYLCHTGFSAHDPIIKRHLRRLAWHAMPYRGHLGFPGEYLLRLSMDLATGSAGVMLGLHMALRELRAFLPFLDSPVERRL